MGKKRGKDAKSYGLGDCEGGEWSLLDKAESSSSYNAFDFSVYENVGKALEEADKDPRVVVAVLTGIGAYYSSGNDLNNFYIDNPTPAKLGALASEAGKVLENFVNAFLDFGKILIAAVNGPAIGIAVTTLGLCDFVFCSDLATFQTPFSRLGQSPEGCSSYVFPRIMGISKANELLIMGKVFSAQDALHSGLVSEVFPGSTFFSKVKSLAELIASFPKDGLLESKKLLKCRDKIALKQINRRECEVLMERWVSDECREAVAKFLSRSKSRSKM